jgi:hypothetical protein
VLLLTALAAIRLLRPLVSDVGLFNGAAGLHLIIATRL